MRLIRLLSLLLMTSVTAAQSAPPAPAPAAPEKPLAVELTREQIVANINILHEYVKGVGLTQPQHVQDALALFKVMQGALDTKPPTPPKE